MQIQPSIYSRQFIIEIQANIDERIVDFFNSYKEIFNELFPDIDLTISILIDDALSTHFDNKEKREDLLPLISSLKKARNKKKNRWYETFQADLKSMEESDVNYPLAYTINLLNDTSADDYSKLFGMKTKKEVLAEKVAEVKTWSEDKNFMLISFPRLRQNSFKNRKKQIYQALLSDIAISAWKYIYDNLFGNINLYIQNYPTNLISKPIFSPTSQKIELETADGELLPKQILDEDGNIILQLGFKNDIVATESSNPLKVMDSTDLKILSIFISQMNDTIYTNNYITMNLNTLATYITGYNPSKAVIAKIRERLLKFTNYSYQWKTNGVDQSFNFFDNITINRDKNEGSENVTCVLGEVLYNSILTNKLISVTSGDMEKINGNPESKIIFYAIQKERISTLQEGKPSTVLSYQFFLRNIMFKARTKKKNLENIAAALNEFVINQVAIEKVEQTNDFFLVTFIPLSEAEAEDLYSKQQNFLPILEEKAN